MQLLQPGWACRAMLLHMRMLQVILMLLAELVPCCRIFCNMLLLHTLYSCARI